MEYELIPCPRKKNYGSRAISPKRRRRKLLMSRLAISSGRQWKKLRRWLKYNPPPS